MLSSEAAATVRTSIPDALHVDCERCNGMACRSSVNAVAWSGTRKISQNVDAWLRGAVGTAACDSPTAEATAAAAAAPTNDRLVKRVIRRPPKSHGQNYGESYLIASAGAACEVHS